MNKNTIYIVIITLMVALGLFFLGRCTVTPEKVIENNVKIVRDTVVHLIHPPPIEIVKYKTKIEIQKDWDTIIETRPFIAKIDTIMKHDTIHADYYFPQNEFNLSLKRKADSIYTYREIVIQMQYEKIPWYERPAWGAGGAVLGFLLGIIK